MAGGAALGGSGTSTADILKNYQTPALQGQAAPNPVATTPQATPGMNNQLLNLGLGMLTHGQQGMPQQMPQRPMGMQHPMGQFGQMQGAPPMPQPPMMGQQQITPAQINPLLARRVGLFGGGQQF